jgi:hypothetical protein
MVLGGATFDFDKSVVCSSPFSPSPPEFIVINNLYIKTGASVFDEKVPGQLLTHSYKQSVH